MGARCMISRWPRLYLDRLKCRTRPRNSFIIGVSLTQATEREKRKIVLMIRTPQQQGSVRRIPQIRADEIHVCVWGAQILL